MGHDPRARPVASPAILDTSNKRLQQFTLDGPSDLGVTDHDRYCLNHACDSSVQPKQVRQVCQHGPHDSSRRWRRNSVTGKRAAMPIEERRRNG